jgi:hypothetical protein
MLIIRIMVHLVEWLNLTNLIILNLKLTSGLGAGMEITISPVYITEICRPALRDVCGSFPQVEKQSYSCRIIRNGITCKIIDIVILHL